MSTTTAHEYLTIAEAAALLRVSPSTIRRWIANGRLHTIGPGERTIRVRRSELVGTPESSSAEADAGNDTRHKEPLHRTITAEEQQRMLHVFARQEALQEELRARYGVFEVPSWELLHEAREERDQPFADGE